MQSIQLFRRSFVVSVLVFTFILSPIAQLISPLKTASAAGEIQISTWEDLAAISTDLEADYVLMNDLDLNDLGYGTYAGTMANVNAGWLPIGDSITPFTGTFDGQGHTISDVVINIAENKSSGLFGVANNATINNLNVSNISINTEINVNAVGAIVGNASGIKMDNLNTTGTISGVVNQTGGLIGRIFDADPEVNSVITNSSSAVVIESTSSVIGGLIGLIEGRASNKGVIKNSFATGHVSGLNELGGLIGQSEEAIIYNSFATGNVSSFNGFGDRIGGLIGYAYWGSLVFDSYATGNVSGERDTGGLFGRLYDGVVANTFSLGTITATGESSDVGGFIGESDIAANYSVAGSFWSGEGPNSILNGIENGDAGIGVEPLLEGDWTIQSIFTEMGWDFDNVWVMGAEHPELRSDITYFEGEGTEEVPYLLGDSCAQIANVSFFPNANYKLTKDIDCSETADWHSEAGFMGISYPYNNYSFTGSFDGGEHTISGITMNQPDSLYVGFFREIDTGAAVFDLTLEDANIIGKEFVGTLAGVLSGTVTNVHATGYVEGDARVGGLVGIHASGYGLNNSSPLVYTWDGDSYEYVADVGEMISRGTDGEDFTVIDSNKIAPKDDVYSINISQEYNEIVYYDKLSLMLFEHAPGYTVVEPMLRTVNYDSLTTVSDTPSNPLLACQDMYGNNCLEDLKDYDDKWSYRDDSEVNEWIMDFGDLSDAERIQLVLRAARNYELTPDYDYRNISVMGPDGEWVQIYGRKELASDGTPRLRTIDLTDKFLTDDYRVKFGFDRLRVNSIAIDTSPEQEFTMQEIQPSKAELSFLGYTAIDNTYFNDHDYNTISGVPRELFANQIGNFTRYGDVLPLLTNAEDHFVVMRHGDQIATEFPYQGEVTPGKELSYILYSDAVYKHADEETGQTVNPLPYEGMTSYPSNGYPMTPENTDYLDTWNTRVYTGPIGAGSTIIDSSANVDAVGVNEVGGLVGVNQKLITGSFATGYVYGAVDYVGGLVGYNTTGAEIQESYADNQLPENESIIGIGQAPVEGGCQVGGLIGGANGSELTINSFARSNVYTLDGGCDAGGFIGELFNANITNSYSTGRVSAANSSSIGGFIGEGANFVITNSFWNNDENGELSSCGTDNEFTCEGEGVLLGKSAVDLKNRATFTTALGEGTWDFTDIWGINNSDNDGFPYFIWQGFTESAPETVNRGGGSSGSKSVEKRQEANAQTYAKEVERVIAEKVVTENPDQLTNKCEALMMISRVFNWTVPAATTSNYTDIPEWCVSLAAYGTTREIVEGRTVTTLGLETPVTRDEVATMIHRELKKQSYTFKGTQTATFTDTLTPWASQAILALAAEGIIKGFPDGTFRGSANILKQDLGIMLLRAKGKNPLYTTSSPSGTNPLAE
jgi:hypothetical protein